MQMREGRQLFLEGSPVVEEGSEHSSTGKVSNLTCTSKGRLWPLCPGWAQRKQQHSQGYRTNGGSGQGRGSGDRRSSQM